MLWAFKTGAKYVYDYVYFKYPDGTGSNYLYCKEGICDSELGNTAKSIKKAFKDLVKIVDKNRANNINEYVDKASLPNKLKDGWISDKFKL